MDYGEWRVEDGIRSLECGKEIMQGGIGIMEHGTLNPEYAAL